MMKKIEFLPSSVHQTGCGIRVVGEIVTVG